ncbi:FeoB-associated Cys-rich membrane protein [Aminicella lysinilytica]|uniref:Uncharacterized protein n=1 Tax=Aminicella lysinilytica TaxID=433323 RepID=A0A4R6Q5R7_9FIRM|nr:FeoB-associated Cys-rich membrane protein [Aminicella lysinilytica]TDP57320.1 hypothetical protein EV211_11344 [Aminicella lysinilytica]
MEYFMSHIVDIIIIGVVLAAVCLAWAWMTAKNDASRKADGEEVHDCSLGCSSCSSFSSCNKSEKKN